MYLRCTPGLATAVALTSLLVLWFTVDVVNHNTVPTVFSNAATMATVASWLYWFSGFRLELAQRHAAEQHDATATLQAVKSH